MQLSRKFATVAGMLISIACGEPARPGLGLPLAAPIDGRLGCWKLQTPGWHSPFLPRFLVLRLDTNHVPHDAPEMRRLLIVSPDSVLRRRLRGTTWAPYQEGDSIWASIGDGFTG